MKPVLILPTRMALAALIALALHPARAHAATYYVNIESSSCSDNADGSRSRPYCSIGAALAKHQSAGTTIHVMAGTYREQVSVPASGQETAPITIQADPAAPVVIDGLDDFSSPTLWHQVQGFVYVAPTVTWICRAVSVDGAAYDSAAGDPRLLPARQFQYVAGQGLYVNTGSGNPGAKRILIGHRTYGIYLSGKNWVTVDGFTVRNAQDRGIEVRNTSGPVTVTRNDISLSDSYGIHLGNCSGITISGNRSHDNGDHGISMSAGTTGCVVENNECFGNSNPVSRQATGIHLFAAPKNWIRGNRLHDNQDTGLEIEDLADSNLCVQNLSWHNGDHGYDHVGATGNVHIGDVAYGNHKDGFSIEGHSRGQKLFNCIAAENGLTTNEYNLWVDDSSHVDLESNDNVFWNSTSQPPVKYRSVRYATVAAYAAVSAQDTRTLQANPRFESPTDADFHLRSNSPAIDNANTSIPGWSLTDADGRKRFDLPSVSNHGLGPVRYADRGALEFSTPDVADGSPPPLPRPLGGGVTFQLVAEPNPIHDGGSLRFRLTQPASVAVRVFAVDGRRVCELPEVPFDAGEHRVPLPRVDDRGAVLPAGLYFCELRAADQRAIGRVVIAR